MLFDVEVHARVISTARDIHPHFVVEADTEQEARRAVDTELDWSDANVWRQEATKVTNPEQYPNLTKMQPIRVAA